MADNRGNDNEQVLSEGEFLYSQDTTKGVTNLYCGPKVVTVTGQEYPVLFNKDTRKFQPTPLANAVQQNILAKQGEYVELVNPSRDAARVHPIENTKDVAPELLMGEKVNIPGPTTFALFPRQTAAVICGHQMRFNEYLLLRVYDEEKARQNWAKAIIKTVSEELVEEKASHSGDINPEEFAVGKLFIIKGTEVSFFIPPTGIEVIKDDNDNYVRQALTLGSLQYCILSDESGDKDYQRGPKVVFPKPTQTFMTIKGEKVFRPIELNEIQGLYIKVIADYEEGNNKYKEGDDLFLTGKDCPIYYPRHEHSIIRYDGRDKHYATAIPSGEARYVLERNTGVVRMEKGPQMLLPNPINEVIVKRVLSDKQCSMWYPGNKGALAYNQHLRSITAPSTRKGVVSEGDLQRSYRSSGVYGKQFCDSEMDTSLNVSNVNKDFSLAIGNEFTRGSTYSEPRTITLDSRYDGVPTIELFTGYAVMVVSKTGERRVEVGPKTLLLAYDESLEILSFSSGKPKSTNQLVNTPYLRVSNNQVSDRVYVETKDHVNLHINMSYRVNFEAETDAQKEKWFEVDNYIKLLCDNIRSILKNCIRGHEIHSFFSQSIAIIRDVLLGKKEGDSRHGRYFSENCMRLIDVEVLGIHIDDKRIAAKLQEAQNFAVESSIEMTKDRKALMVTKEKEQIKRETIDEQTETRKHAVQYALDDFMRQQDLVVAEYSKKVLQEGKESMLKEVEQARENYINEQSLARQRATEEQNLEIDTKKQELKLKLLTKETESVVKRFEAAQGGFTEALLALSNSDTLTKVAEVSSIQNFIGTNDFADLFKSTPLEEAFHNVLGKSSLKKSLNGSQHVKGSEVTQ